MKQLLLLRHAKSSWKDPGLTDFERPLNKRGKRDAPRMGRLILDHNLTPDLIISSAAVRASQTAVAVAESSGYRHEIQFSDALYMAAPGAYITTLAQVIDEYNIVLAVGHNPGIEDLLAQFDGSRHRMSTAALAHVALAISAWPELRRTSPAEMLHIWRPKELAP